MFTLDSVSCADSFPADGSMGGAQIVAQAGSSGGFAAITGNDAYVQLAFVAPGDTSGQLQWTPPVHMGVGNLILAAGTRGIRFANYTAGKVAVVSAGLSEPAEPPVQPTAAGVSTPAASSAVTVYRKNLPTDVVNTVAQTDLLGGAITLAAGVLGTTGALIFQASGDYLQNAGVATRPARFLLQLGATTLFDTGNTGANQWPSGAGRMSWRVEASIFNAGATNAQTCWFRGSIMLTGAAAVTTSAGLTTGEGRYYVSAADSKALAFEGYNTAAVDTTVALPLQLGVILPTASPSVDIACTQALAQIL